jgi:hypothetical protein
MDKNTISTIALAVLGLTMVTLEVGNYGDTVAIL